MSGSSANPSVRRVTGAKWYRLSPFLLPIKTLAAKAKADGNWDVHNFALGAAPEYTTINVADSSLFSSLLPAAHAAAEFAETAVVTDSETIEVRTLNQVVSGTSGNTLLKIDTQGYERQVLEGGRQMLSTLKGILMELPIIHLYERTWQFHEAIAFMAANGFVPAQFHPVNFHPKDEVSLVEVDCLFRLRDKRMD
jgi:FkbM family methyltransferase